jgi:CII-binding regulator of phage lambda lysogenization HflD
MPQNLNLEVGRMKDQWRQEFRETRREITRLQAHLVELKRKLQAADEILLSSKEAKQSRTGKYSDMGLTQALRSFFIEHRYTSHSISELKRRLEMEGMKKDLRDLRANIATVCRRLHTSEHFLASELRNGILMYRISDRFNILNKEQAGASKPAPAVQSISNV